jgi:hypothetical protein
MVISQLITLHKVYFKQAAREGGRIAAEQRGIEQRALESNAKAAVGVVILLLLLKCFSMFDIASRYIPSYLFVYFRVFSTKSTSCMWYYRRRQGSIELAPMAQGTQCIFFTITQYPPSVCRDGARANKIKDTASVNIRISVAVTPERKDARSKRRAGHKRKHGGGATCPPAGGMLERNCVKNIKQHRDTQSVRVYQSLMNICAPPPKSSLLRATARVLGLKSTKGLVAGSLRVQECCARIGKVLVMPPVRKFRVI